MGRSVSYSDYLRHRRIRESKKRKVLEVLHWDNEISSTAVRESKVATLVQAGSTDPGSFPRWSLDLITILGIIVGVGFWSAAVAYEELALQIAAVFFLGLSLLRWFLKDLEKSQVLNDYYLDLCDCCEELLQLEKNLSAYLTELDDRTSRYFHCVTTSKVTNYYVLGQILGELGKFNEQLEQTLRKKSWHTCATSYALLQSDLKVADGNLLSSGQMHELPVFRVTSTVAQLTEMLEEGLREIEQDIKEYQGQYVFDEKKQPLDRED